MSTEALLLVFDLALRGGVCMVLALVAGLLLRDYPRRSESRLGALFAVGVAAFAVWSGPDIGVRGEVWMTPAMALSVGNNFIFWLFARSLFDDGFRPRAWHAVLWVAIVALGLTAWHASLVDQARLADDINRLLSIQALGFAVLAVIQTQVSWTGDLIEGRRRLRLVVIPASAAYIGLIGMALLVDPGGPQGLAASMFSSLVLALLSFAVAWSMLVISGVDEIFAASKSGQLVLSSPGLDVADQSVIADITHAMTFERLYRQEGMSIRQLSEIQELPEDRLRRLINQALGYRSFAAYLNSYRMAEAKAALADENQDEVPISTIAADAGFGSFGSFSRAFKKDTGLTPPEFRKRRAT